MKKYVSQGWLWFCLCFFPFLLNAQSIEPYLQAITPTSIAVNWKTNAAISPAVRYGPAAADLSTTVTGGSQVMTDVGYSNNYFYHTVKLSGLQPATKYY